MSDLRTLAQQLVYIARDAHPNEACGLVFTDYTFIMLDNVADDPVREFALDPSDILLYFGDHMRDELLGVWHTHPRGTVSPSDNDLEFPYKHLRYFIVTATDMYEWSFTGEHPRPINPHTRELGVESLAYPVLASASQVRP